MQSYVVMHSLQIHDKTLSAFFITDVHAHALIQLYVYVVCTRGTIRIVVLVPATSSTAALLEYGKNGIDFFFGGGSVVGR